LLLALLVVVIIALLLLPIRLPPALARWHALADALENLGHPVVFALLGICIVLSLRNSHPFPSWRPVVIAGVSALALGAATEYVQALVGRDGSWGDLFHDLLGCLGGVSWLIARECRLAGRHRPWRTALLSIAMLCALAALAPLAWTTFAYAARAREAPVFWRADSAPMQLFSHREAGRYPALVIHEPPADWRAYRTLVVEVVNGQPLALELNVRVHDRWHDDRYSDRFNMHRLIEPGVPTQIRVAMENIRAAPRTREMDMSWIRGVSVFVTAPATLANVQVRRLYFER